MWAPRLVDSAPGIVRFQFRQVTPDSFELLIIALPESIEAVERALSDLDVRSTRSTGQRAHSDVHFVEDIPVAPSGKHLYVIPLEENARASR